MTNTDFSLPSLRPLSCRLQRLAAWVATLALLSACTTGAWYEGMQISAQQACERQAPGAREDCLSRLNKKSYDGYSKERAPLTP
jgi:hypothetical protein